MSVIVHGMDVPANCMECDFHAYFLDRDPDMGYDYEFCRRLRRRFNDADDSDCPRLLSEANRWPDCPIREVQYGEDRV